MRGISGREEEAGKCRKEPYRKRGARERRTRAVVKKKQKSERLNRREASKDAELETKKKTEEVFCGQVKNTGQAC